jgi:hypothetical protein
LYTVERDTGRRLHIMPPPLSEYVIKFAEISLHGMTLKECYIFKLEVNFEKETA